MTATKAKHGSKGATVRNGDTEEAERHHGSPASQCCGAQWLAAAESGKAKAAADKAGREYCGELSGEASVPGLHVKPTAGIMPWENTLAAKATNWQTVRRR